MIVDPEVKELVERIAFANFNMGVQFNRDRKIMNCPLCSSRIKIGGFEIYETLVEHVCEDQSVPRVIFCCCNPNCKVYKKGFWGDGGSFYRYKEGCEKLEGEALTFGDKTPDLASYAIDHEKYKYTRKGIFIGKNWKSISMKAVYHYWNKIVMFMYLREKNGNRD